MSLNRLSRLRGAEVTGRGVTDTASVSLEISSLTEVNFTAASIDFGIGSVAAGAPNCTLNSYDVAINASCSTFTPVTSGLVLENVGNKNVTLTLSVNATAQQMIGGTGPKYYWNVSNLEENSCPAAGLNVSAGAWYEASADNTTICNATGGGFQAADGADTLNIDVSIIIPTDATLGAKASTITASIAEI